MTATIEIRNGPEAGRVFHFEEDMCRIGSGASSVFRVEGLDDHALTVHFRDGQYFVINRCAHSVRLNRRKLEPNESAPWEHQQVLQINGQHEFALNVSGDPAAAQRRARAIPSDYVEADPSDSDDLAKKAKPNRPRQIVIIGLAFLGMILLATGTQQQGYQAVNAEFDEIVRILYQQVTSDDIRMCFLRENLKTARALELQGRNEEAKRKYKEIQDKCLRNVDRPGAPTDEIELRAREFIARRLERLGGR